MSLREEQSQDSFRQLVEAATCMIVILREDHSIAYFNSFADYSAKFLHREGIDLIDSNY